MFDFNLNDIERKMKLDKQKEIELQKKWALICQGGGFKGSWEAGFINAILGKTDFKFISHIGTSIGSINAALTVLSRRDENILKETWNNITWLKTLSLFRSHKRFKKMFFDNKESDEISKIISNDDLSFISITTKKDNQRQEEYAFIFCKENDTKVAHNKHSLIMDSIIASASFPYIFPNKRILDKLYEDGGTIANNPILHGINLGLMNVLVLSPLSSILATEKEQKTSFAHKVLYRLPIIGKIIEQSDFSNNQTIRSIKKAQTEIIQKAAIMKSLCAGDSNATSNILKNTVPEIFVCFPTKKLKTGTYILEFNSKIKHDYEMGYRDGMQFIKDYNNHKTKKYRLENVKLRKTQATQKDKKLNTDVITR